MKKVIALVSVVSLFLIQCNKESDPSPNPSLGALALPTLSAHVQGAKDGKFYGVVAAPENGQIKSNLTVKAPAGFKSMKIYKVTNEIPVLVSEILEGDALYDGKTQFEFPFNYKLTKEDGQKLFSFRATIIDKKDRKAEALKIVDAEGKAPMTFFMPSLTTTWPVSALVKTQHYLLADTYVYGASMGDIVTDQSFEKVQMIFSGNDGSGFYLSSPNAVLEENLLIKFKTANISQLKVATITEEEFKAIGKFDPYKVEELFENTPFGSNPEKAEQISKGKVVLFRTHDMRTGVLLVKEFYTNTTPDPDEVSIDIQLWICQPAQ